MLILYNYDSNFIHVEPMPNRSGASILATYNGHTQCSQQGDCDHSCNAWTMKPLTLCKNS